MSKVILDLDLGYYSENGVNLLCMEKQINMTQCQQWTRFHFELVVDGPVRILTEIFQANLKLPNVSACDV